MVCVILLYFSMPMSNVIEGKVCRPMAFFVISEEHTNNKDSVNSRSYCH